MFIKQIRTEEDYEAAMNRIDEIFGAPLGTPVGNELDWLVGLVEAYEAEQYPDLASDQFGGVE